MTLGFAPGADDDESRLALLGQAESRGDEAGSPINVYVHVEQPPVWPLALVALALIMRRRA